MVTIYLSKRRLEAFSDAVFAILMTLLVLELKSPILSEANDSHQLMEKLLDISPKFLIGTISFISISVIWINHYNFFHHFKLINHIILFLNVILLLTVSFLPYPTAVIGNYPMNETAIVFYGGTMFSIYLVFSLMKLYAYKDAKMIEDDYIVKSLSLKDYLKLFFSPFLYLVTIAISFIHPYLAYLGFILLPIYNVLPGKTRLKNTTNFPETQTN